MSDASYHLSMPPSVPLPSGSPPPSTRGPNTTPNAWPKQDSVSSSSNDSTTSATPTTGNCELDWASSVFPMALNVTREESSPEYLAEEEARWLSQRGSDRSGMGLWNYWQGGSQGNPPTLSNSTSALTILRTPRRLQLPGSSPSSPPRTGVITRSSKKFTASTTLLPPPKCIDTVLLKSSGTASQASS